MIKRILIPVKSTQGSNRAIDFACEMGKQLDASIHLVTVDCMDMEEKNRVSHQLMKETVIQCREHDIDATYSTISAKTQEDVARTISRLAEDYDLIVMGHCKYEKIYKFLRDSIAENLINMAPCPVLVATAECVNDIRNTLPVSRSN